ncbi:cell division protein FtsX [Asticcacaulis machinosus]|uniref:ABC transporter permease n=1 Tax=Asticcacaulis machinosus TaxID=2984211 RepID=A0ABT5HIG4_9CAUL|nr:ABC transporter permease [Asticcacaulis machinosus]MDC7676036.1 ABC transporter permease [Asticcacaulis machinosus]
MIRVLRRKKIKPPKDGFPGIVRADLLPAEDTREVSLHFIIAVLCFIACLSAILAMASDRAAQGWARDIRSEVTVQVRPSGLETGAMAAAKAAEVLGGVKGVEEAAALEPERARDLIKPWLGDAVLDDLPIPNLVEVRLDPEHPATAIDIMSALTARDIDASLDDHSTWLKDIEQSALIIRLISFAIFTIVAVATGAVVSFATRAGLATRSDIIEILSLCGASDGFIAQRFQSRFMRLAVTSGVMGAAAAGLVTIIIKLISPSQSFALALPFSWFDLLILIPCPLLVALISATTARMVTLRLLGGAYEKA